MSDIEVQKRPSVFKQKDIRQTAIFTVIITFVIGYGGSYVLGHVMGPPASNSMATTIFMMQAFTWASAPIAGLVAAMALTTLLSNRHSGDFPPPDAEHQIRNSPRLVAVWLVVSSILCLFAVVWGSIVLQEEDESLFTAKALNVSVTGQQWLWNFDYIDNGTVRSAILYLPVNRHVVFHVTSKDVIHSFWIVQMGIKIDANPGYVTETSVTPTRIGIYDVRCAELCGLLHANMQTKVHVVSQADYDAWIQVNGGKSS